MGDAQKGEGTGRELRGAGATCVAGWHVQPHAEEHHAFENICVHKHKVKTGARRGRFRAGSDARRSSRVQSLMLCKSSANCLAMLRVPSVWERGRACGITCAVT
eukprot:6184127-Pleurochrysis_carterae.AAC.1